MLEVNRFIGREQPASCGDHAGQVKAEYGTDQHPCVEFGRIDAAGFEPRGEGASYGIDGVSGDGGGHLLLSRKTIDTSSPRKRGPQA